MKKKGVPYFSNTISFFPYFSILAHVRIKISAITIQFLPN